jgi:hypothetical protein
VRERGRERGRDRVRERGRNGERENFKSFVWELCFIGELIYQVI